MDDDFDIGAAVDDISTGIGLDITPPEADDKSAGKGEGPDVTDVVVKGETTPPPAPAPTTGTQAPAAPAAPAADGATPPAAPKKAPHSWRPEAKAEFDKLSPTVQDEVLKREEDILRGIGTYKAAADFGHAVDRAIQPYVPLMKQANIDPVRHVGELFRIHHTLATGAPEVKQAALMQIARDFGINLPAGQSPEDSPYVDPEVAALRTQMQNLQSMHKRLVDQQTAQHTAQIQEQRSRVEAGLRSELNTFASDPEHAFFDEVADDMAILIQSGRAPSLKQAYELAIRMQPAILEKENLRAAAKGASKKLGANNAAAAKTTAARNATGVNVKAQPAAPAKKSVAPGAGLKNLDMSIEAAFDNIMSGSEG